jgi:ABC-2 type transport system ATP-binding protein
MHSPTPAAPMVETTGLRKAYRSHEVLRGIDLAVPQGGILALLGPNGAGKTTTVNILTTLVRPDGGSARVGGIDVVARPREARALIAMTGQYAAVDEFQTGRENLAMMAELCHLGRHAQSARVAELLEQLELDDAASRRVSSYSGGMRRRLDLAISLIARPAVLVLDEPTTGLDPRSRAQVWQLVEDLASDGTTILLTTQYLEEADRLAHRIAVLDDGRIVAEGTAAELKQRVSGNRIVFAFDALRSFETARRAGLDGAHADLDTLTVSVPTSAPVATIRDALARFAENAIEPTGIEVVSPTLDDVFLSLTGRGSQAAASGDAAVAA